MAFARAKAFASAANPSLAPSRVRASAVATAWACAPPSTSASTCDASCVSARSVFAASVRKVLPSSPCMLMFEAMTPRSSSMVLLQLLQTRLPAC